MELVDEFPRLRGKGHARINYRHIIDWLIRKPGAFGQYRYREELFPTSRFRMALDWLKATCPLQGHKEYLKILELAAKGNETVVDEILGRLLDSNNCVRATSVELAIQKSQESSLKTDVIIEPISLDLYDTLLTNPEVV